MIRWWNTNSIAVAEQLWKPGLNPIKTQHIYTDSWYKSSVQTHIIPEQFVQKYETQNIKEFNITRKIKINPTKEQREKLTEWWHSYRYTYNKTVEEIGKSCLDETRKIVLNLNVIDEQKINMELGYRFEMEPTWKLDLKYIKEPKLKFKINVNKANTKITSTKIVILEDPAATPIRVKFHFEYPEIESWYTYRNKLVTSKLFKCPKDVDAYKHLTKEEIKEMNLKDMFRDKMWVLNTDKRIRAGAVKDARASYETICTLAKDHYKKGTLGPLPFKRKKYSESWSISMEKTCIKPCVVEKKEIGRKKKKLDKPKQIQAFYVCPQQLKTPILCYEKFPTEEFGDPKIHKDKWGDWWLLLPIKKMREIKPRMKQGIALDPGISTFVTGYSDNGKIYNYVEKEDTLMTNLKQISCIQGMIDTKTGPKKKQQIITKLRKCINNKVNDMHWKVINSLVYNHNLVVLGKFNVQSILKSDTIHKSAKRKLQALSHYKFKTRLKYKAASVGAKVKIQNEWGTTKGCPCCGRSNKLTLADRIFKCTGCDYVAKRDDKAACCIMLKHLSGVW